MDRDLSRALIAPTSLRAPWRVSDAPAPMNSWPWRPLRDRDAPWPAWRRVMSELTHIVARSFWQAAYPCCLGYRYGHSWKSGRRVPANTRGGGGWIRVDVAPDELIVAVIEIPSGGWPFRSIDYDALIQGPPVPCPTCGRAPRRELVERWRAHVQRERARL